ncbi:MAG: LCP family protein [Cyanobacteriota bacterium]|nr:LCP family protein [Cyanobacteriota bacterium]
MVTGLGGGLVLAAPLADLLGARQSAGGINLTNPFSAWTGGLSQQEILLLGTDEGGGNTDVIATLRVDGGITRVTQIPRDTYIEAEGFGPMKINALYSVGGLDVLKSEIAHKLGRPVEHHLVINLAAIRRMADLIGGIEVDVPKRMVYVDNTQGLNIDLQPGRQTLRGRDLEGFLRFRHDESGDIGRMERQQLALQALFHKLTRPEQLVRLPALLMGTGKDVRTDLGPMELGGLLTMMGSTRLQAQHLGGRPFDLDGVSYWEADWPLSASSDTGTQEQESGSPGAQRFLF